MTGAAEAHAELRAVAARVRLHVLEMVAHAGAGHVGGPLSAADLLAALYFRVLDIRPAEPHWRDRDRFVLSKGHSSAALYATLALRGYFPVEELLTFDAIDSRLQGHPDMTALPGIDMSTGALGQGLSAGIGIALGARLSAGGFHTWVMLGDGETQEGQVWEALMVAARYRLSNLTAIVDWNGLQQYGWHGGGPTGRQAPLENGRGKLEAFGWRVAEIDGHDFGQILSACDEARAARSGDRPTAILARTVKGKGVSFCENRFEWHAKVPSAAELEQARLELGLAPEGRP